MNLRLAHVAMKSPFSPLRGNAEVCIRLSGSTSPWYCLPYADAADVPTAPSKGMTKRFPIKTSELLSGRGLELQIRDDGTSIATNDRAAHASIGIRALCSGLRFPLYSPLLGHRTASIGTVVFYLDDA